MSDIAFTVDVDKSHWNENLRAWMCSAIAIPGAEIEAAFVDGRKEDEDWFKVDYGLKAIKWIPPKEPPENVTFKLKLTKNLSTYELTARWKKFAIVLPALGVLVGLLPGLLGPNPVEPLDNSEWSEWTVKGHVKEEGFKWHEVDVALRPPYVRLNEEFDFSAPIWINSRSTEPPQLVLTLSNEVQGKDAPVTPVIDLLTDEGLPLTNNNYNLEIDEEKKIIHIASSISFWPPDPEDYNPSKAPERVTNPGGAP